MNYAIPLIAVSISSVAIILSYLSFQKQYHSQTYSDIDLRYFEILKLGLEYPELRNKLKTSQYYTLPKDDPYRIRYETYAYICWNLCEAIFDRQKRKSGNRQILSTWLPVILEENNLHRVWFSKNLRLFKKEFPAFINELVNAIEVIPISDAASKEFKAAMEIYQKQFPVEERKSVEQLTKLLSGQSYTLFIARHKFIHQIIGFAFVLFNKTPNFLFLDYMAIDPLFQSWGFGTVLFRRIMEMQKPDSSGVLFELEKPDLANTEPEQTIRTNRIQFYMRLGCILLTGLDYKLPNANGAPVPMELAFRPNTTMTVLPAEIIKAMVSNVYDKIHTDVPDRQQLYQDFVTSVHDQPL